MKLTRRELLAAFGSATVWTTLPVWERRSNPLRRLSKQRLCAFLAMSCSRNILLTRSPGYVTGFSVGHDSRGVEGQARTASD
jgi:hypothetical protein